MRFLIAITAALIVASYAIPEPATMEKTMRATTELSQKKNTTKPTTKPTTGKKKKKAKCFPADATLELQDGSIVAVDSVSVGDMVKVGVNQYSRVFMFTHKMTDVKSNFVAIKTASGAELSLTSGHYLYVNGALSAAQTVVTGDELILGDGDITSVISVASVEGTGLFNPQTVQGDVVVNGILSSTYTTAVDPSFAHAILSPFRALQNIGFFVTALESGGDFLTNLAPRATQSL